MNKRVITILATTMLFATLAVASVQAQDAGNMSVTIPFDFAVAGKKLPAGKYHVRRSIAGTRSVTEFQNSNATERLYLPPTHPVQSGTIQSASKLVFNRYGNQYFLSQVWIAGRNSGEELTKTTRERLLQRELARRAAKPETVAIDAKPK
jgi:hypothetical protein